MRSDIFFERFLRNWPAKVLSVAIAVFLFLFYRMATLEERFISIPLEVKTSEHYIPARSVPDSVRLTIRGRGQEVSLILPEDIQAVADFSSFTTEGEHTAAVTIRKRGAALQVDTIEMRVEPAAITLPFEKKMKRSVDVVPTLESFPEKGYELSQYFLTPTTVEVEGVRSRVENLEEVKTEAIDLSGKTSDFTVRVRLQSPHEGIRFLGGDVVEFYGVVQESVILKTLDDVELIVMDLDPSLQISGEIERLSMRVQGKQLLLEGLGTGDIRAILDFSGISDPGTYTLNPVPDVPQGVLVLRYEPLEIDVTLEQVRQPGETPPPGGGR